jgi:YHS domain-containing protein
MKYLLLTALLVLPIGCASSHAPTTTTDPHAECLVCKKNVDLACVDVAVDKDTPRETYNGKTYYFCSEECKGEFEKNPAKYAR